MVYQMTVGSRLPQKPGMDTGGDTMGTTDKAENESPNVDEGECDALFSSFSNSETSKSSTVMSSKALSTTDSTVSAAG